MPRRIAYLCGMTYLDYDQTMTQDFASTTVSPTVMSFKLTFCNCCLVPTSISYTDRMEYENEKREEKGVLVLRVVRLFGQLGNASFG